MLFTRSEGAVSDKAHGRDADNGGSRDQNSARRVASGWRLQIVSHPDDDEEMGK